MSLTLEWMIGADDNWCLFEKVDPDDPCFDNLHGVYIVWYGPSEKGEGRVVCAGHGLIRNKIKAHRDDPILSRYSCRQPFLTWAEVDQQHRESVAAYLNAHLNPLHGSFHGHAVQTLVNLPW